MDEIEYDIYGDLDDFNLSEQVKEVWQLSCYSNTTNNVRLLYDFCSLLSEMYAHFKFRGEITFGGRGYCGA